MSDELRSDQGIPSLRTVAMPADANPNGDIFGGWLMSQMDLAGGTFAAHVARGRVVTVAVDGMTFHKPVNIGDQVSCYCTTERIGRTSISVRVETWIRPRGEPRSTEQQLWPVLYMAPSASDSAAACGSASSQT